MAEPDPVVQVIPWDLKDCGRISVEITASGRLLVDGEPVEPIEVTRQYFRARKSDQDLSANLVLQVEV